MNNNMDAKDFLIRLEQSGWVIVPNSAKTPRLHEISVEKLKFAGGNFEKLITSYFSCSNLSDDVWFLSWADFSGESDSSFLWNEFEIQSLDAAMNELQRNQVTKFWSQHIPFLISVRSGYSYIAISIEESTFGKIVLGNEPEYEETIMLSDSLEDFFKLCSDSIGGQISDPRLAQFV